MAIANNSFFAPSLLVGAAAILASLIIILALI